MTNQRGKTAGRAVRRGFTLIEAIVVIVIIGVLAAVVAPNILKRIGQSEQAAATASASSLYTALKGYIADHGEPQSGAPIDILWERPSSISESDWKNSAAPYVETKDSLIDPWGNKYILAIPGPEGREYAIMSYGRDGKAGGEGQDKDIVKP